MSHVIHSLLAEIQHQHSDDSHLSQDVLTNIEKSLTLKSNNDSDPLNEASPSEFLIQTPIKSTSTSSLPFFDPSFFSHCKASEIFFFLSFTFLTILILLQAQQDDPVLSTVYK